MNLLAYMHILASIFASRYAETKQSLARFRTYLSQRGQFLREAPSLPRVDIEPNRQRMRDQRAQQQAGRHPATAAWSHRGRCSFVLLRAQRGAGKEGSTIMRGEERERKGTVNDCFWTADRREKRLRREFELCRRGWMRKGRAEGGMCREAWESDVLIERAAPLLANEAKRLSRKIAFSVEFLPVHLISQSRAIKQKHLSSPTV